jgi:hypothetical protein
MTEIWLYHQRKLYRYTVTEPSALQLAGQISAVLCNGGSTGSIDITMSGGTPNAAGFGYQYIWSNGANSTQDLSGLTAGTYTLTVTDGNGCIISESYTVTEPSALQLAFTSVNVSSYAGNDGLIDLTVSGGISPYTYYWSNGSSSEDLSGVEEGIYTITVTDANGCTIQGQREVFGPADVPSWAVTNTGIIHQIIIPQGTSVEVDNVPLEAGDYLGVFFDQQGTAQCGGLVQYQPGQTLTLNAFKASVGQDNGFQEGEVFSWKVWKLYENAEYDVFATYLPVNFGQGITHTGNFGTNGLSKLDSISTYFQSTLSKSIGATWSIISVNVIPTNLAFTSVIQSLSPNVIIAKNENGLAYWPQYGLNLINTWVLEEGYQIKMSVTDIFEVSGVIINPEDLTIHMPVGWSIIGYPRQQAASAITMMAPVAASLSIMKNQTGQVYWPAWMLNNIGTMKPGEGYQIKMNNASNMTFPAN